MSETVVDRESTLLGRARSGVLWVALVTLGGKSLSIVATLLLTRILTPRDFGLVAASTVVIQALAVFTDLGLGAALIHSKGDREKVASTAFFLMPVIGGGVYALAFVTAPALVAALGTPDAAPLVRIVALTVVITSLTVVPSMLMEKDMRYRRKVLPDLVPSVFYAVAAVVLAVVFDLGAYAIAWALVLQSLTSLVLNWIAAGWRPKLLFDRATAAGLMRYGRNILGGTVIAYLTTNMDNGFVSRTAGPSALGIYTLAYLIANLPATHVADVLGRVLFPTLVRITDDPPRLQRVYVRAVGIVIVVAFPLLAGLSALADRAVGTLLGDSFTGVAPLLPVLAIFAAFRCLAGATGSLFLATGNTRYILANGVVGLIGQAVLLSLFLVVWSGGILAAAWAVSLMSAVNALYIARCVHRIMPFHWRPVLSGFARLALPSALMGVGLWVAASVVPEGPISFGLLVLGGGFAYLLLLRAVTGAAFVRDLLTVLRPTPSATT